MDSFVRKVVMVSVSYALILVPTMLLGSGETIRVQNTTDDAVLSVAYAYEKTRGNMVSDRVDIQPGDTVTLVRDHALDPGAFAGMYPRGFGIRARIFEQGVSENSTSFHALIREPGSTRTYVVDRDSNGALRLNTRRKTE